MTKKIGVLIGSLRKDAWTRKVANQFIKLAPKGLELHIIDIGNLPLYNEDLETSTPPASWTEFRNKVSAMDGVLLISPEYNRSMSGALKNAIDVGSRLMATASGIKNRLLLSVARRAQLAALVPTTTSVKASPA